MEFKDLSLLLLHEDVGESYNALTRSAANAVGAEACHLALYDPDADEVIARRPRYDAPGQPLPQYRFRLDSSPASALVVRTGEPYVSNDPGSDPLYNATARERGVKSILTVPIKRGERVVGLFYAINKPGNFTPEDAETLGTLADAAGITLDNIRLYAEERQQRLLNESLREVSRALVGTPTEDAALGAVLDQTWRVVPYQAAAAVLVDDDGHLRVAAVRGGTPGNELPLAEAGDLRDVLAARQLGVLSDAALILPRLGVPDVRDSEAIAAPLLTKVDVLGAIVVAFEAARRPGLRDGHLVSAFADHAALFLEAGRLLRRERQARSRASALARVTRMAATRLDAEALLQTVAPELLALSGADRAVFYLRPMSDGLFAPVAEAGAEMAERERWLGVPLDLTRPPLASLTASRDPLLLEAERDSLASIPPFSEARALLMLPLFSREEILGVVALAWITRRGRLDAALVSFLRDVAEQVALGLENARLIDRLTQMAATDDLTELANRRRFGEAFRLELARARRLGSVLSLVLADVDHLKQINDAHGHPGGDVAIKHVADALRRGRRETDLAARLGGEEFALVLPDTDIVGAVMAAQRIRKELAESTIPSVGTVTVSMGVASYPEDGVGEETLLRTADARLYSAKAGGRNRVWYVNLPPPSAGSPGPRSHELGP